MTTALSCLFLLLHASNAFAQRSVMEQTRTGNNTIFIATRTAVVGISTQSYNGGIINVGLYSSSNVVVSNTRNNNCVIYATGSVTCLTISGSTLTAGGIVFNDGTTQTTAASTIAVTTNDMNTGTWLPWTPTWGGYSAAPTGGYARYVQIGKMVHAQIGGLSAGTSNATTLTVTLPVVASSAANAAGLGIAFDNGAFSVDPCRVDTRAGSATADVFRTLAANGWTASGGKVAYFVITYEAQ